MVNTTNPHYITQNATGTSLTQPVDTVDFPHSGLIKALNQMAAGNVVVKTGTDFDINQTGSNLVVAAGKILRNGEYHAVGTKTFADSALTTTYAKGYHLLVVADGREGGETVNELYLRPPTALERVPEFKLGDTIVAMIEYSSGTSAGSRLIQYFTTNKESNSLSIAYGVGSDPNKVYTPTGSISGAATGTNITNTIGDFTIDNQVGTEQIILQLGSDDQNTAVVIKDNSGNNKLAVTGGGRTQALGTLEVGTDLKMSTSSDNAIIENVTSDKDIIFQVNDGGSANSEVMRIDGSTSRVGIGTDTPTTKLEVSGDTAISRSADSGQTRTLSIEGARNATGTDYARIDLENYDSHGPTSYVGARISAVNDADGVDDGSLVLSTANAGTLAERMRIDDEGNVGIGTNSPDAMLHLSSGVDQKPQIILENTRDITNDASADEPEIIFLRTGDSLAGTSGDLGKIRFRGENDADQLVDYATIFADGPDETDTTEDGRLITSVFKDGNLVEYLRLSGTNGIIFNHANADVDVKINCATEIQDGLTTTGAVLTLSTKETTVVANDVLGKIDFKAPSEASGTDAILPGASITALASDTFDTDNNETDLVFSTASSDAEHGSATSGATFERMRINSGGKVGIGTTTPDTELEVDGVITSRGIRQPVSVINSATTVYAMTTNNNIIICSTTAFAPGPPPSGGPLNINLPAASAFTIGHQMTIICTANAGGADAVDLDIGAGSNSMLDENLAPLNGSGPLNLVAGATYTVIGYDATTWLVIRLA